MLSCLLPEQFTGEPRGVAASFRTSFPEDVREKVLRRWQDYGFADPARPPYNQPC
ncbi:hypothetical protein GTY65_10745 [Streptomyces sp. SID8379]|uniref:hypothetical protein n=1 Tax=unclassified Streptomyces TaxID=2593676 RepID=UPI000381B1F8|nr:MULTISPECIES: hypothetical protein [unclassified Streptomyces]MYW64542.1 hypothetical protein [Streptomyces sp. SID8379]